MDGLLAGCGKNVDRHIAAFNRFRDVVIHGVWDADPQRAADVAKRLRSNPDVFSSYDEMLQSIPADFVDLDVPDDDIATHIDHAADRKINVLIAKPGNYSSDAIQHIGGIVNSGAIRIHVIENWRYHTRYRALKREFEKGSIGDIVFVRHIGKRPRWPAHRVSSPVFLNGSEQPILRSMGLNWLDTARYLFGEPDSIYCQMQRININTPGEDVVHVTLRFPNNIIYQLDGSYVSYARPDQGPEMVIEGTSGTLTLGREPYHSLELTDEPGTVYPLSYVVPGDARQESYDRSLCLSVMSLANGSRYETDFADYFQTLRLIAAGYMSSEQGQAIQFEREPQAEATEPIPAEPVQPPEQPPESVVEQPEPIPESEPEPTLEQQYPS